MNDTVTIMGFIGNDPQPAITGTGVSVLNFRVGSTQRRYDAKAGEWVDSGTNWYSVSAYRQLADHARDSLRKGQPVIVTGRLKVRDWDNGNGARGSALDLDADAIGHDLRWGSSAFVRPNRAPVAPPAGERGGETPSHDEGDPHDGPERAAEAAIAEGGLIESGWEVADESDAA